MANLTSTEIEKILKIPGEARGVALKTDAEFIIREKGVGALKNLEAELERISYPIKYGEIENMNFYPISLRIISLRMIKNLFGFDEEKIKEMGTFAPKTSLIIKFFMQYFLSLEKTLKELSKIWEKHYTVGSLQTVKVEEKNKIAVIKLEGADFDPIFCCYLLGYLCKVLEMIVGVRVLCEETKCVFRGDNCHEYSFKW